MVVQPASEQVMDQPGLDLLQLGDQRLRLRNRPVGNIQDLCNLSLFIGPWQGNGEPFRYPLRQPGPTTSDGARTKLLVSQFKGVEQIGSVDPISAFVDKGD